MEHSSKPISKRKPPTPYKDYSELIGQVFNNKRFLYYRRVWTQLKKRTRSHVLVTYECLNCGKIGEQSMQNLFIRKCRCSFVSNLVGHKPTIYKVGEIYKHRVILKKWLKRHKYAKNKIAYLMKCLECGKESESHPSKCCQCYFGKRFQIMYEGRRRQVKRDKEEKERQKQKQTLLFGQESVF